MYVSSDKNAAAFRDYFRRMPWLALPFSDRERATRLSGALNKEGGIPSLVRQCVALCEALCGTVWHNVLLGNNKSTGAMLYYPAPRRRLPLLRYPFSRLVPSLGCSARSLCPLLAR